MKKHVKSILVSTLMATAFGALSVGTTFALFTSQAKTEIDVESGKVALSSTFSNLKTYSALADENGELVDERGYKYSYTETSNGVFTNTGTASYSTTTGILTLDRMTPGDRVTFDLAPVNASNVTIKYRYTIAVDATKKQLAKALVFKLQESGQTAEEYKGLADYSSDWIEVDPIDSLSSLSIDIAMPMDTPDAYQNLESSFVFTFEAVQGNAHTTGEKSVTTLQEDIVSAPVEAVAGVDTVVTASSSDMAVSVTVPADASYDSGSSSIAADDKITVEVSDLGKTEEVYSTETSLNFDLTLKVNGVEANNFATPLSVRVYVGPNLVISSVNHDGVEVTNYTYDSATGYITFETSSFSPFSVEYLNGIEVRNEAELRAALLVGGTIGVKADITASSRFIITKDIRMVGFGHIINVTESGEGARAFDLDTVDDLVVNFENVKIKQSNASSSYSRGISLYECKNIVINFLHAEIESTYYAINVASLCDNVVINMSDSSASAGWCAMQTWSSNTTFNIENSLLKGTNDKPYNAKGWNNFATIVLNEDVEGVVVNLNSCAIESNYSTYIVDEQEVHNKQLAFSFRGNEMDVNINNSTFKVNNEVIDFEEHWYPDLCNFTTYDAIYGLTITLNGGIFYQYEA